MTPTGEIDGRTMPILLTIALAIIGFLFRIGWSDMRDKLKAMDAFTKAFGNPEEFLKRIDRMEDELKRRVEALEKHN